MYVDEFIQHKLSTLKRKDNKLQLSSMTFIRFLVCLLMYVYM